MRNIEFKVFGQPAPKGSMKALQTKYMKFPILKESNKRSMPWVSHVKAVAQEHRKYDCPWEGPVGIALTFEMEKPKSYPKTKERSHVKRPDIDKLTRAILDSCTGILIKDDSQVVVLAAQKVYSDAPGVEIVVKELESESSDKFF